MTNYRLLYYMIVNVAFSPIDLSSLISLGHIFNVLNLKSRAPTKNVKDEQTIAVTNLGNQGRYNLMFPWSPQIRAELNYICAGL